MVLIEIVDTLNGKVSRVNGVKRANEFFEQHERPNDLVILEKDVI